MARNERREERSRSGRDCLHCPPRGAIGNVRSMDERLKLYQANSRETFGNDRLTCVITSVLTEEAAPGGQEQPKSEQVTVWPQEPSHVLNGYLKANQLWTLVVGPIPSAPISSTENLSNLVKKKKKKICPLVANEAAGRVFVAVAHNEDERSCKPNVSVTPRVSVLFGQCST